MMVRVFETYPPSSFLVSIAVAVLMVVGGPGVVVIFVLGAVITSIGMKLDTWGLRSDSDR